ncbi:hypothetical protein J2W21_002594 [Sinomonas atrocyanea]|uniref:hypothetical protein n=1 Tax=Sinomonas atrocyanea TaxID=37927 RepID=UPI0027895123|nr:hypothetical protein [Sinomonas atrocyanea]MDP9885076.1 hypothetical protein [Sinomonas atrocyanea]
MVGYVPGEPALYPRLTGLEHVDYLGRLRGRADRPSARAVAERLGLDWPSVGVAAATSAVPLAAAVAGFRRRDTAA